MHSTSRVLVCIVQLCFKHKDWNALNEHIVILTKRRSQLKQVRSCELFVKLYFHCLELERWRYLGLGKRSRCCLLYEMKSYNITCIFFTIVLFFKNNLFM